MKNNIAILAISFMIVGCASTTPVIQTQIQRVEVPVSTPCKVEMPIKPDYGFGKLRADSDIFTKTQTILSDRKLRQAYEKELEVALSSCR